MAIAYTLQEIVSATTGKLFGGVSSAFRAQHLLTDSRRLVFPQATVFFALKTPKNDGHKYLNDLLQKGVRCFVVSKLPSRMPDNAAFILVNDTLLALHNLGAMHRSRFSIPVVGITGSNGKTIVKEWLAQLLSEKFHVVKNPRSYNSQTGVPLSVWQMEASHEMAVFEAGISLYGEMVHLQKIIKPQWGIFTNIGPAHDEGFADREEKIREKLTLFCESELLIYHADDPLLDSAIRDWAKSRDTLRLFRWGKAADSEMQVLSTEKNIAGSTVQLKIFDKLYQYNVPFTDEASLENVLHCIAFLHCRNFANGWVAPKLMQLQTLAMRLELRQGINNCTLVNDAYNSDLLSLGIALDFLENQVGQKNKTLILSDILQAGMEPRKLYSEVAALLKARNIQSLIGIGPAMSLHQDCFKTIPSVFFENTQSFLHHFDLRTLHDQGILLKGARDFGFERISNALQYKDHQTLLEIDLDALVHNLNVYKAMLADGVKITAMVKAFSYGSGSYEIANILQYHQVDYLAVAFADEGKELRNAGISLPVMVLNPELHNLDILFRYRLEPEIYSLDLLKRIIAEADGFAERLGETPFPVHIKLDTGMHRLGFMEHELDELIGLLKNCPLLHVASVFSHLSASDLPDYDDFSQNQMMLFRQMANALEQALGYDFIKHIANSAAISRFPEAQMDMVRLGIGLYGVDGNKQVERLLHNVTTFKSVISQVKSIPAGHSVGYNRAAILEKDTEIAIVPVGYADGLNRRLSKGRGYLLINGKKAPILGNISMDMCCVDVSGLDARAGDEVIIFGKDLPVTKLARKLDTIPYEVFTSIASRVKRIYFQE